MGLAADTDQGLQILPGDPAQAREILRQARFRRNPQRFVSSSGSTSELSQIVGSNVYQLQGSTQPYQAYTPDGLLIGLFNGVAPRGFGAPLQEHGVIVWTWSLPLPRPVYIHEQRQDNGATAGQFDENNILDTNVLTYTMDYRWRQATVGGVTTDYFKVKTTVGNVVLFDTGDEEIATQSGSFPLTPVFRSAYSGEYTLSASQNGTHIRTETYRQKGIAFDDPFPAVEIATGDPPEPVQITNAFHWDDLSELVQPAWKAFIDAIGADTGQQPGASIDFTWSPADLALTAARGDLPRRLRLVPRAQCPNGCCDRSLFELQSRAAGDPPIFPYTVEASAQAYEGVRYRASRNSVVPGQRILLISDEVTPETLDPDAIPEGSTEPVKLHYRARLAAVGFNTVPSYDWVLEVRKKDTGKLIRTFLPDESLGASIRFPAIDWDARVEGVALDPTDYKFELVATACESGGSEGGGTDVSEARMVARAGDPGPCVLERAEALFRVTGQTNPQLEVLTDEVLSGPKGAVRRVALEMPGPHDLTTPDGRDRWELLKKVNPSTGTWQIRARDLRFEDAQHQVVEGPEHLKVVLESTLSQGSQEMTLTRVKGPDGTFLDLWEGLVLLAPDLIKSTGLADHTYCGTRGIFGSAQSTQYLDFAGLFGAVQPYTGSAAALGVLDEKFRLPVTNLTSPPDIPPTSADNSRDNVLALGFEAVLVRLEEKGSANEGLVTPLVATVKVKHPAEVLLIDQHGGHDGGIDLGQDSVPAFGDLLIPDLLPPGAFGGLRTLYLTSCEALDLHDYNNLHQDHGPNAPVADRQFGGALWHALIPGTNLLGYAGPVALLADQTAMSFYRAELGARGGKEAESWVWANLKAWKAGGDDSLLNACAFDGGNYYYIPFKILRNQNTNSLRIDKNSVSKVWRVPSGQWNTDPPKLNFGNGPMPFATPVP